jgi:hypothetical protein
MIRLEPLGFGWRLGVQEVVEYPELLPFARAPGCLMRLPRLWTDRVLHTDIIGHRLGEPVQPLALPFLPLGQASHRLCQFPHEEGRSLLLLPYLTPAAANPSEIDD